MFSVLLKLETSYWSLRQIFWCVVIINCIYEVLWDDLKSVKNCRFFNCDKTRSLIAKLIFSKNKLLSWITFDLLSAHMHVVEKHNLEKIIFTLHWLHFILFCSVSTDLQFVSYTKVDLTGAMPDPLPLSFLSCLTCYLISCDNSNFFFVLLYI